MKFNSSFCLLIGLLVVSIVFVSVSFLTLSVNALTVDRQDYGVGDVIALRTDIIADDLIFKFFSLKFQYRPNDQNSWVTIKTLSGPFDGSQNVQWDTSSLAEGEYSIRSLYGHPKNLLGREDWSTEGTETLNLRDVIFTRYDSTGTQEGKFSSLEKAFENAGPKDVVKMIQDKSYTLEKADLDYVSDTRFRRFAYTGNLESGKTIYSSIQVPIDKADLGETVQIKPGTYDETVSLRKKLNLRGSGLDSTFINAGGEGPVVSLNADEVKISGLTFTNWEAANAGAIFGTFNRSVIENNKFIGEAGIGDYGIWTHGDENVISGNSFEDIGAPSSGGPAIKLGFGSGAIVSSGNVFNSNQGDIWIYGGGNNTIKGNSFNSSHSASVFIFENSGNSILKNDFNNSNDAIQALHSSSRDNSVLYNNILNSKDDGIELLDGAGSLNWEIHYNKISGNNDFGVVGKADASLNYWGDISGPFHANENPEGTGDRVSDNVIFSPWLGIDPDDDPGKVGVQLKSPMTFVVDNVGPVPTDGYLNTAIGAANDLTGPDNINVNEGTYDSSRASVEGPVMLSGPNSGVSAVNGNREPEAAVKEGLIVRSTGVIVDGFKFSEVPDTHPSIWTKTSGRNGTVIRNNIFQDITGPAIKHVTHPVNGTPPVEGIIIEQNRIDSVREYGGPLHNAIWLKNITNSVIRNNEISNVSYAGLLLDAVKNVTVSGNYVHDTYSKGIQVAHSPNSQTVIENNTIENTGSGDSKDEGGVTVYPDVDKLIIRYNKFVKNSPAVAIRDGKDGEDYQNGGVKIHYNSFNDNSNEDGYAVANYDDQGSVGNLYATLNWWGSDSGPTHTSNPSGTGALISDNVIYSPWLGDSLPGDDKGIDADPDAPGVQLSSSVNIIVDDVGPKPTTEKGNEGWLNKAIWGSNQLVGRDTIIVNKGYYTGAEEPVTESANIRSETCPECSAFLTRIDSDMNLNSNGIQLGTREHGFTILGDITIGGGVDPTSVHINWNDILGNVTNNGSGTLDAQYNYWGGRDPEDVTTGNVDTVPSFDVSVCIIEGYLRDNPTASIQEANAAIAAGDLTPTERARVYLSSYGLTEDETNTFIEDYGAVDINSSFENTESYASMVNSLAGYGFGPAGGAGGILNNQVAGGAGSYKGMTVAAAYQVGETIEVNFDLSDFQGNPVKGEHAVVTVAKLEGGGPEKIVAVKPAEYGNGSYRANIDTTGFEPGHYRIYIDLPNGSSAEMVVEVEG